MRTWNEHRANTEQPSTSFQDARLGEGTDIDARNQIASVDRIVINVAGIQFITSRVALRRYPFTRLGRLSMIRFTNEFYFDRNPKLVVHILDLYRTGELHIPRNCCSMSIKAELDFWDIPPQLVSECCWLPFQEGTNSKQVMDDIETTLRDPYEGQRGRTRWKNKVWATMNNGADSELAPYWNIIFNTFVIITVTIFVLDTMPDLRYIPDHVAQTMGPNVPQPDNFRFLMSSVSKPPVVIADITCWVFFSLEFAVRFLVCPSPSTFIRSKLNILDIFLIIVVWSATVLEHMIIFGSEVVLHTRSYQDFFYVLLLLRGLKALRVLRICHIMSRHEYIKVMTLSLNATFYPLSLLMIGVLIIAVLFGSLMYIAELSWGSFRFKNVGIGVWWAVATLLAVGYGDVVPITAPGYIAGILCECCGVVVVAMPIAIISTTFKSYMISLKAYRHRQDRTNYIKTMSIPNARRALTLFLRDGIRQRTTAGSIDVEAQPIRDQQGSTQSLNWKAVYKSEPSPNENLTSRRFNYNMSNSLRRQSSNTRKPRAVYLPGHAWKD